MPCATLGLDPLNATNKVPPTRDFSKIIGYGALTINALAAILSLAAAEWLYKGNFPVSYILAIGAILVAFGSLSPVFLGDFKARDVLLVLVGQGLALILINAGIHFANGLVPTNSDVPLEAANVSAWTAIYFSTVTWTTLGYGDFAPHPMLQVLAALEACAGLTFFGVLIGFTVHQLNKAL